MALRLSGAHLWLEHAADICHKPDLFPSERLDDCLARILLAHVDALDDAHAVGELAWLGRRADRSVDGAGCGEVLDESEAEATGGANDEGGGMGMRGGHVGVCRVQLAPDHLGSRRATERPL